jgi:hypothetical protein
MSNETTNQIQEIELNIEAAKEALAFKKAVQALLKNAHFKKVITEGYFKEEASRVVLLKADASQQSAESQNELNNSIIAIGYLRQYLSSLMQLGTMAENAINSDEQTLEELHAEALGE